MIDTALTLRAFNGLFPNEDSALALFERAPMVGYSRRRLLSLLNSCVSLGSDGCGPSVRAWEPGCPRRPTINQSLLRWDAVDCGEVSRTPRGVREIL
jgi:hypothetical protein